MRVIPVLDLKAGQAVHARAGDRARYRPVRSIMHEGSDPVGLARAYRDRLGLSDLYLADLDAIAGAPPALALYHRLQTLSLSLWVDAGIRDASMIPALLGAGVSPIVAGLETVRGPDALGAILDEAGRERVAFSLDLRDGRPLVATRDAWGTEDAVALAERAIGLGCRRVIVLDLARVGTGRGVGTRELLSRLIGDHPDVEVVAGGGVSGPDDLADLARIGVSAALVGSALHDGRIDPRALRGRV